MDPQAVEIVGRNYLVSALVADGLEVARPERDRGVDLIAYLDLEETGGRFIACPIQMKAASSRSFGVDRKYEKFPVNTEALALRGKSQWRTTVYVVLFQPLDTLAKSFTLPKTYPNWDGTFEEYTGIRVERLLCRRCGVAIANPWRRAPAGWVVTVGGSLLPP